MYNNSACVVYHAVAGPLKTFLDYRIMICVFEVFVKNNDVSLYRLKGC